MTLASGYSASQVAKPEDAAEATRLLLSSQACFIKGKALSVNGGAYRD